MDASFTPPYPSEVRKVGKGRKREATHHYVLHRNDPKTADAKLAAGEDVKDPKTAGPSQIARNGGTHADIMHCIETTGHCFRFTKCYKKNQNKNNQPEVSGLRQPRWPEVYPRGFKFYFSNFWSILGGLASCLASPQNSENHLQGVLFVGD